MKLIPEKIEETKRGVYLKPSVLIEEFRKMDVESVRIDGIEEYYTCLSAAKASLLYAAKKYGYSIVQSNGKLYIVKP